jgi:hypothetical protein
MADAYKPVRNVHLFFPLFRPTFTLLLPYFRPTFTLLDDKQQITKQANDCRCYHQHILDDEHNASFLVLRGLTLTPIVIDTL